MTESKYIEHERSERIAQKKVIAKFNQEIVKSKNADLGPSELIPILDNLKGEYNIPRIVRTANIFGCREVFIIGTEFFNPYPAVGAVRHTRIRMFKNIDEVIGELNLMGYQEIFALLPPVHGGRSLFEFELKPKTAFIAGHERYGLSFDPKDYKDVKPLHIPQIGVVESLNVSVAMSIALAEWARQNVFKNQGSLV